MDKPRIGFIGLGLMGHGMAANLLRKGFPLAVKVNRDRSRLGDILAAGARECATNAEVATEFRALPVKPAVMERWLGGNAARLLGLAA